MARRRRYGWDGQAYLARTPARSAEGRPVEEGVKASRCEQAGWSRVGSEGGGSVPGSARFASQW
jgi:hypothetical protein